MENVTQKTDLNLTYLIQIDNFGMCFELYFLNFNFRLIVIGKTRCTFIDFFYLLDFILAGKQVSVCKYVKNEVDRTSNNNNLTHSKWVTQEEALKNEEDIAESGRIFVRNLAYTTKEDDLEKIFAVYGKIIKSL